MPQCQFYVIFILIFVITNIDRTTSLIDINSKNLRLEAPHLSDKTRSSRPNLKGLTNFTGKTEPKSFVQEIKANPCDSKCSQSNGTTYGLKEIMIGRCYYYQYVKRSAFLLSEDKIKNCTELYAVFEAAVRHKSYCYMNMDTYKHYFDLALADLHVINRAMFWSGTYTIAHSYAANGRNYVTLEDTLAAAMVDGLIWCGKENDTEGFDFVSCPYNCKDNKWADYAFWGLASKSFAQLASGEIYVVLNGSQLNGRSAFRNDSYFSAFELPNLRQNGTYRVTKVNALILHSPDSEVVEKCGEKSLLQLKKMVEVKGFEFVCKDDPDELLLIMCSEHWKARECQVAREVLRRTWNTKLYGASNCNRYSLLSIIFSVLCMFYFFV